MKILLAASEMEPFASSGPFGQAMSFLSGELRALGHEVSIVLPYYRTVRENAGAKAKKTGARFSVNVGNSRFPCEVLESRAPNGVQVFFIARDEYFDRSGLYGIDGRDYQDNAARFIYFSKCVTELARRMEPIPEILHAHNWQAALVPVLAQDQRLGMRTVLTAHSLEFQGNFWSYDFGLTTLPDEYFSPRGLEYYGSMNLLKGGILAADSVALPGPRFAAAARLPAHGCGLDPVIREQEWKVEGVSNGLDANLWSPSADKTIAKRFKSPDGKRANQKAWLNKIGLASSVGAPLLLVDTSAMESDGMPLLLPVLDRILASGVRLAVLGPVALSSLAGMEFAIRRHRGRFAWLRDPDDTTFRLALAASDAMLFAAPVSPDATTLMIALQYGVVPIAQACGGLHFVAPDYDPMQETGLGFIFYQPDPEALLDAVRRAVRIYREPSRWQAVARRAMDTDFSWTATAHEYESLYATLLARGTARAA